MGRPGIMLYFDMLEPISLLTNAERGKLLTAMLEYGKEGKAPAFQGKLALTWGFVQPKLDRDENSYDIAVLQRKYAGFCSRRSSNGLSKIGFDDWLELDDQQRKHMLTSEIPPPRPCTAVDGCAPTTTSTTTSTTASTATATSAAKTTAKSNTDISSAAAGEPEEAQGASLAAAAAERKRLKSMNGLLGQGLVHLTEEQIEVLLDKLGLEEFDRYVKKLSDYIRNNNATVRNHYVTILKWWTQDSTADIPPAVSGRDTDLHLR